jgi:phosphoribosylaminoimidazole carboxylase PurE protein
MAQPLVAVVMGSKSDREVMAATGEVLEELGVEYETVVTSAHRTPERTRNYIRSAVERGVKVIVAGAGMAAHLPGVIAAETVLPVIGVPLEGSALKGMDALLAIVQMPGGIPVATCAIGKAGARNAGILAAEILALNDSDLAGKLIRYREKMAEGYGPLPE